MKFEIGTIWIDPPGTKISSLAHAFTNIDADVRIYIGDRLFFDAQLCIVEFANAIQRWLSSQGSEPTDFRFESSDDEEPRILCLEIHDEEVRIFSAWQKFSAAEPLAGEQVVMEMQRFVQEVTRRCRDDLKIDVESWIGVTG